MKKDAKALVRQAEAAASMNGAYRNIPTWRVQRFYELLVEIGHDEYVQAAIVAANRTMDAPITGRDDEADAQAGAELASRIMVDLDLGKMIRALGTEGRYLEMVALVCGLKEGEDAKNITTGDFEDALPPFITAWLVPITTLLGLGKVIG